MPGTTRYSATFDRTYEEEDRAKAPSPPNARRSRSQSWQANSGLDGRQYTPFVGRSPGPRSSSTDNNPNKGTEHIPTRTAKTSVKAHNNPFQFVKVGTCPLYKKAEEQLKKAKEIKKPDVLKEEEEEWQSNLDSWKSRRRKMSEDVFRRQEELKLLELEEQIAQVSQKKTKTFSEMVESRATRGRALSLCLLTSPLEFQNWEFENKTHKNGSCSFTDESGENSTVNSEDEGVSVRGRLGEASHNENGMNHRTNGDAHIEQNGSKLDTQNGNCNKLSNNVQMKPKESPYIDSGLESISSSHRAGDTPDSGSDFSQDSNSSIDCDSPRTGVNVLEEFNSKSSQVSEGHETTVSLKLDEKGQDFGFTFLGGKDEGQVIIASILEGSKAESSSINLGDRIITIDGCDVSSKKHIEIAALIQKGREKGQINLILWRHTKSIEGTNGFNTEEKHDKGISNENLDAKSYEKSIESENEMYVDDFEELKRQSELLALNKKSDTTSTNTQAQTKEKKSPNKDAISLKTSPESSTAPILKTITSNSAVEEPDKNEQKNDINSVINNENQKKNIIKVKRVRRKGVYALNVDPNQISQDGISTNSLFPLSPVTELPSPADETKTVSSTLSSYNILPVYNSQNGIAHKGKQNDEMIKPSIPIIQENNTISSTSKSESSKSGVPHTKLKNTENFENKTQVNSENTTEAMTAPSLTSKNEGSTDEKSKSISTPKKIKSSKLKENSISSENASVTPATEVVTASNKIPASSNTLSNNTGIQSLKLVTNGVEALSTNELSQQSKVSTSEDTKPKKIPQKKIVAKSKGNTAEKKSSDVLNEIYSTKEQNSSSLKEKQEKLSLKNGTTASPLKEENNAILNGTTNVSQDLKPSPAKDETSNYSPSTNKVRDLALKFGEKKASPNLEPSFLAKNVKSQKNSLNEKSKPVITTKMESPKIKENGVELNQNSSSEASISSVSNALDSSSKNTNPHIKDKQVNTRANEEVSSKKQMGKKTSVANASEPTTNVNIKENGLKKEVKSLHLTPEKQSKLAVENSKIIPPLKKENSVQQVPSVTSQTMKETSKSSVSNASDTSSKSTDKEIKTKKEKMVPAANPEKQTEITIKNQSAATSLKGDSSDEQVSLGNQQISNKLLTSSVPNASDSTNCKNLTQGIQSKKEKKILSVSPDQKAKSMAKTESKVSPLTRVINFYKCHK